MLLNVTNEVGRLKSVLVHLPGREIDMMIPSMMGQLLFDDILFGQVAREEHRRFQQIIYFIADQVYDIQDLLEEVFEDAEVRAEVLREVRKRYRIRPKVVEWLQAQTPASLAEAMIGGLSVENQDESGATPKFYLPPVPNLFFMRDPQTVIGNRVAISAMASEARAREPYLSRLVFRYHKAFRGRDDVFWLDREEGDTVKGRRKPTVEGGDVLVMRRDLLVVGTSERTNRAGIEHFAAAMKEAGSGVRTIIVVELPKKRSYMHVDTVFTPTSASECLVYPPVMLPGGADEATVYSMDLTKRNLAFSKKDDLFKALRACGVDLKPISCGGTRPIDQQREQWTDGANAFALAPGIILLYERNVRTAEELSRNGYHIVYEDDLLLGRTELETWTDKKYAIQIQGHELSRARGGPHCMTMPLEREEI
jgi:arginine deiminase